VAWKASQWHTLWQGSSIVLYRDDAEVDRVAAADIRRVVVVYGGAGDTPGDLSYAVIETDDSHVIFPAETGIAGRIHFERQSFWSGLDAIYWVPEAQAGLPARLRRGSWLSRRTRAQYQRLPKTELAALVDAWPLEGPQTWEQRKWERIERSRPFAAAPGAGHARAR